MKSLFGGPRRKQHFTKDLNDDEEVFTFDANCSEEFNSQHASPGDLVQSISDLLKDTGVTLMLEPGRSLVANSAVLLARVLGCKMTANKRYVITDASMTEVIRPCLYGSYHHVTALGASSACKHVYDIVGPVCESADVLGKMTAEEVLVDDSTRRNIRRQDSFDDFLAPYKNLK